MNQPGAAKVQSALLETMQERQVTLGGETMPLPSPSCSGDRKSH